MLEFHNYVVLPENIKSNECHKRRTPWQCSQKNCGSTVKSQRLLLVLKKRTQWRLFFDKTQLLGCDRCGYSTRRAQQLHMYPQAGTLHCTAHCHPMWVRQYNGVQNCTENCTVARRYINQSKKWFRCVTVLTVLTVEGFAETKHHSKLNFVKSWVAKVGEMFRFRNTNYTHFSSKHKSVKYRLENEGLTLSHSHITPPH